MNAAKIPELPMISAIRKIRYQGIFSGPFSAASPKREKE